jgi:hypothetical protein
MIVNSFFFQIALFTFFARFYRDFYFEYENVNNHAHACLERILNLRLTDLQWRQSTLPIRFGGLGIRRISDRYLPPCFPIFN